VGKGGSLQSGKLPVATQRSTIQAREAAERTRWRDLPFLASVPVGSFPQKLSGTILPFATKTI
jgi:hypothetical protein